MHSLSARLLVLTISFVMLAEVLIFGPSVARFRVAWMEEKLGAAHLAVLALEATPDGMVGEMLRDRLLDHVGAIAIFVRRGPSRLVLTRDMPPSVDATVDLMHAGWPTLIGEAFAAIGRTENRVLRIMGHSPKDPNVIIQVLVNERDLHVALVDFAWRIFWLSAIISLITAALVYFALQWLLVRPMRRITANIVEFRDDPEDARRSIRASDRSDEIGIAERELADMQEDLRGALRQQSHLAALGTAVAKVNHDLRGILSSALLVSDRLETSADPDVKRITPRLVTAIERAVALCAETLNYVGKEQPAFKSERFSLHALIVDIEENLILPETAEATLDNAVAESLEIEGDRAQLYRVVSNLAHNAVEAGATHIVLSARENGQNIEIDVRDNGSGLPPRALENLFKPFDGSVKVGGTGLGLAISAELMRNHGGSLSLVETDANGTCFRASLPQL